MVTLRGRANYCPWDSNTCTQAAARGHLELLKWARLNGCPWDANTYDKVEENGDPALMRYLEDDRLDTVKIINLF